MKPFLRLFLAALFLATAVIAPAQAKILTIGYVDLPCHTVSAELLKSLLERMGYNISLKKDTAEAIFAQMAEGEVDIMVAAWLPRTDASSWESHKSRTTKVSVLYDNVKSAWAVPDYVPESLVRSIADLSKPEVSSKMEKSVAIPGAHPSLLQDSSKVMEAYGLGSAGYQLTPASVSDWTRAVQDGVGKQRWFVIATWQPNFLNRAVQYRVLEDPKQLLGGSDRAYLLANAQSFQKLDRPVSDLLKRVGISNKAVVEMESMVMLEGRTPHEAARRWMAEHPNTIEYWYTPEETDSDK
jgi:glycine betaine/proline transport system substrate-binding protein